MIVGVVGVLLCCEILCGVVVVGVCFRVDLLRVFAAFLIGVGFVWVWVIVLVVVAVRYLF